MPVLNEDFIANNEGEEDIGDKDASREVLHNVLIHE